MNFFKWAPSVFQQSDPIPALSTSNAGSRKALNSAVFFFFFIDDLPSLRFQMLCGWVVINPIIAYAMLGIILLIIAICLTLQWRHTSICPFGARWRKIEILPFEWKIGGTDC